MKKNSFLFRFMYAIWGMTFIFSIVMSLIKSDIGGFGLTGIIALWLYYWFNDECW